MKKVVFLLALILFGIKSQCQSVFEGKVLSKDGKSLAEASIIPENAKKIIYTNDSGFFKLTIPNSYNVIKLKPTKRLLFSYAKQVLLKLILASF